MWLEDCKKRCGYVTFKTSNLQDTERIEFVLNNFPKALELLERAKSIMNQWTHSVDEDSYDDAYMRATQWIEEVEG